MERGINNILVNLVNNIVYSKPSIVPPLYAKTKPNLKKYPIYPSFLSVPAPGFDTLETAAPKFDTLEIILASFFGESSILGRSRSSRALIMCNFLHASKQTSCFDKCELRASGPMIVCKAALGGRVSLHLRELPCGRYSNFGFGVKYLHKLKQS